MAGELKKIAILSDIHGNIAALEKVVEDINKRYVDHIINLGDHISGPLWPKETIEFLMKQNWIQISGNHDRRLFEQNPDYHSPSDSYAFKLLNSGELHWLKSLPSILELPDGFLLFHGTPSDDNVYLLETIEHGGVRLATPDEIKSRLGQLDSHVLLCGHTHIPRVVELSADLLIINPGSVGLPAYDDELPEYHVVQTGSPHARYVILEYTNGSWTSDMISISYDYEKAAEQAGKNGRPDWEVGLRTGFMLKDKKIII